MDAADLQHVIQAKHIMAPVVSDGCIDLGSPQREAKQRLLRNKFDFGLVRDDGDFVGMIPVMDLADSIDPLKNGPRVRPLLPRSLLTDVTPLPEVLCSLEEFPFHAVIAKRQVVGVIHTSDLNKHPAYGYFYLLICRVEQCMIGLIRRQVGAYPEWKGFIPEPRRRKEVEKRTAAAETRDLKIDPLNYLYFSEYIAILACYEHICRALRFDSSEAMKSYVDGIQELRNHVAHPAHDLIDRNRTVSKLLELHGKLQSFLSRLLDNSEAQHHSAAGNLG